MHESNKTYLEEAEAEPPTEPSSEETLSTDTLAEPSPAESPSEPPPKPPAEPSKPADKDGKDGKNKNKVGYFIVYEMKVEGLKKESKLENSKKSLWKSMFNYLGNFFDDVTFKASGIFGSGNEFKVKDVKDYMRKHFGPIDPDELVKNVEERIRKKFANSTPNAEVRIQDKRTLVLDLGS